jgi:hypothetical protein
MAASHGDVVGHGEREVRRAGAREAGKEKAEKRVRRLRETLAKFVIQVRSAEKSWQSLFSITVKC